MATPRLTICPPAPAHIILKPEPMFGRTYQQKPVSAEFDGEGFQTTGIAFEDYMLMQTSLQTKSCVPESSRRLPTPTWAVNERQLRALLVRFFERRARLLPQPGTYEERLKRAVEKINAGVPRKIQVMDSLCAEYVRSGEDPDRQRVLAAEIENLDTTLRLIQGGPGVVARMVHLYYSVRLDSVGVGEAVGCKPPHVRQTLWRLAYEWARMTGQKPTARPGWRDSPIQQQRKAAGLCRCGGKPESGYKSCRPCLDSKIVRRRPV